MIAQFYKNECGVRLFDASGLKICDLNAATLRDADTQLSRLRIRRRGAWESCQWGAEAKVRFR